MDKILTILNDKVLLPIKKCWIPKYMIYELKSNFPVTSQQAECGFAREACFISKCKQSFQHRISYKNNYHHTTSTISSGLRPQIPSDIVSISTICD